MSTNIPVPEPIIVETVDPTQDLLEETIDNRNNNVITQSNPPRWSQGLQGRDRAVYFRSTGNPTHKAPSGAFGRDRGRDSGRKSTGSKSKSKKKARKPLPSPPTTPLPLTPAIGTPIPTFKSPKPSTKASMHTPTDPEGTTPEDEYSTEGVSSIPLPYQSMLDALPTAQSYLHTPPSTEQCPLKVNWTSLSKYDPPGNIYDTLVGGGFKCTPQEIEYFDMFQLSSPISIIKFDFAYHISISNDTLLEYPNFAQALTKIYVYKVILNQLLAEQNITPQDIPSQGKALANFLFSNKDYIGVHNVASVQKHMGSQIQEAIVIPIRNRLASLYMSQSYRNGGILLHHQR